MHEGCPLDRCFCCTNCCSWPDLLATGDQEVFWGPPLVYGRILILLCLWNSLSSETLPVRTPLLTWLLVQLLEHTSSPGCWVALVTKEVSPHSHPMLFPPFSCLDSTFLYWALPPPFWSLVVTPTSDFLFPNRPPYISTHLWVYKYLMETWCEALISAQCTWSSGWECLGEAVGSQSSKGLGDNCDGSNETSSHARSPVPHEDYHGGGRVSVVDIGSSHCSYFLWWILDKKQWSSSANIFVLPRRGLRDKASVQVLGILWSAILGWGLRNWGWRRKYLGNFGPLRGTSVLVPLLLRNFGYWTAIEVSEMAEFHSPKFVIPREEGGHCLY